jgi:hypothetical protein
MHRQSGYAIGHVGKNANGRYTASHSDGHVSRHKDRMTATRALAGHYNSGKTKRGDETPKAPDKLKAPEVKPSNTAGESAANRLAAHSDPRSLSRELSNDELSVADKELTRRAEALGKPGQVARHHRAAKAEITRRGGVADEDFAGPNHSFPIKDESSVGHAASLAHHAKDPAEVKAQILRIAGRKFPEMKAPPSLGGDGSKTVEQLMPGEKRSGETLFHGTSASLKSGDVIDPKMMKKRLRRLHGDDYAFATTDRKQALGGFASGSSESHVYRVEPVGDYETDPHMHEGTARRSAQGFRIVEEVDPHTGKSVKKKPS